MPEIWEITICLRYKKITYGLKRSEFCINEQTGKEDYQTQDRKHRHLPYSLWHIIAESNNDYLTHLLKIGLDAIKREHNGNTLLYKILNRLCWISVRTQERTGTSNRQV
jgi:hypothetical protein